MKLLTFLLSALGICSLFAKAAFGEDARIIEVRRRIPLSDQEPLYRDYYIKTDGQALKPDMQVTAVRKVGVKDPTGNQNLGEISVPVGLLKIIHVENNLAVARETKTFDREKLPLLEQSGIMSGDLISLKNKD